MKKTFCAFIFLIALGLIVGTANAAEKNLRHVVILKFKEDASAEQIQKVEAAFLALKTKVPKIVSLEWGTNISKENRNKGFTHCFFLTFAAQKDLDDYAVHPEHKAFVEILKPTMADVFVVDYWAKE